MRPLGMIMVSCLLLVMAGCQWFNEVPEESPPDENHLPDPPSINPPVQPKEQKNVVVLGLEGFEQEVELSVYTNEWIRLEYDRRLEVRDEKDRLIFRSEEDDAQFCVQPMDENTLKRAQSDLKKEGYELYNTFELDDPHLDEGQGFIYYLYKKRHQVELYAIAQKERAALVRFDFLEAVAEKYMFVFDYMLASIELLVDGEKEGVTDDENEKEAMGGR